MEKWRVASCSFQFNTLVAAIACVSSRHEFTRGGELIRAFLSLPSSHLCISVLPFLPFFFTVSRAISHFASFSLSFLGDNRSIVSTNNSKTIFLLSILIVFSFRRDYIFSKNEFFQRGNKASTMQKMNGEKKIRRNVRRIFESFDRIDRE